MLELLGEKERRSALVTRWVAMSHYGTERPMLDGGFNDIQRWEDAELARVIGGELWKSRSHPSEKWRAGLFQPEPMSLAGP